MNSGFFNGIRPGKTVRHGAAEFELPILYFRDDLFMLFFSADAKQVRALMPSDKLHPVTMPNGRALLAVAAFNYLETSIGPYGEIGVVAPATYGKRAALPLLPGLLEGDYPGFGVVVLHLPVTKIEARDAGRGEWGYAKFVSEMRFLNTPEVQAVELSEGSRQILSMRVPRGGMFMRETRPLVTFSVLDGKLIQTTIPQQGSFRVSLRPTNASLILGDHPLADSLRELDLSARPFMSRYYIERCAILPAGRVIETGVRPLEGHRGQDGPGLLDVRYM